MNRKYQYRGLPIQNYCICGVDKFGGSGVLEWCVNSVDAQQMLELMEKSGEFENLHIEEEAEWHYNIMID